MPAWQFSCGILTGKKGDAGMKEANIIDVERAALEFLLKARKDAGLTETELGKKAFPESSNPRGKVHAMWSAKTYENKALR